MLEIDNRTARSLWLATTGLAKAPTGSLDLSKIIRDLGFVQLDTIQVVSRAHHHILWSRNQNYREPMLDKALGKERSIFEHFTHDASVLPMEFLPMWKRQFKRRKDLIDRSNWYSSMPNPQGRKQIKDRIRREGPLSTHDFDTKIKGEKTMWQRPPHKLALDYMWYSGELATCHRVNFTKFYNLAERVFPVHLWEQNVDDQAQVHWLCEQALDRLSFGNASDVHKFWEATDLPEVKSWVSENKRLVPLRVQSYDNSWVEAYGPEDIEDRLASLEAPTTRLRILNPFDPAIRDRNRAERLFGFNYRIEMFVPAAKRQWGYYVYPILEGDRFVGRIEVKADRKKDTLNIIKFWPEGKTKWGAARIQKLHSELKRMARFININNINWFCKI
ncbi:MAG: crosslink repair DNA glycosylase YcaQ family protein [Lentilitoribacter sp.]